jgi:RNA polymerase sigma factor (sigma-70 family)
VTKEDAADLTQDAFLQVLANPPANNFANFNPKGYLYRASHNLTTNHKRRSRALPLVHLEDDNLPQLVDPGADPERLTYLRQVLSQTADALDELPERTRRAFHMHRVGGQTMPEIGKELGISTGHVCGLIQDAYQHLLQRVGKF